MAEAKTYGPTLSDIGLLEDREIKPETDRLHQEFMDFFREDPIYRQAIIDQHWASTRGIYPSDEIIYSNRTHLIKAVLFDRPDQKLVEVRLHPLENSTNPRRSSRWDISSTISAKSEIYKKPWLGYFNRQDPEFSNSEFIQVNTIHARNGIEDILQKLKAGSAS